MKGREQVLYAYHFAEAHEHENGADKPRLTNKGLNPEHCDTLDY